MDDEGGSKDEKDSEERRREAMVMIRRAKWTASGVADTAAANKI